MLRWSAVLVLGALLIGCNREDYSTPRHAARTFYIALVKGELDRAERGLCDQSQAPLLSEVQQLVSEVLDAQKAAVEKFGEGGKAVTGGMPSLDDLDGASEVVNGSSASVSPRDGSRLVVKLRRIRDQWKVDLLATFELQGGDVATAQRTIRAVRQMVAAHTRRIREGHYQSATEAESALQSCIRSPVAMQKALGRLGGVLGGAIGDSK